MTIIINTTTRPDGTSHEVANSQLKTSNVSPTTVAGGMPPKPVTHDERLKRPLNSNRSGGPRSSEGRARCSLNAIKHGGYVTANSAGLEYQQILSELTERVNPVGRVEEGLVESLAVELLRLSTLGKLEVERLQSAVSSEVNYIELAQALDYPWASTHLEVLRNPPQLYTLRSRLVTYLRSHLASLQAQCVPSPSDAESRTLEALRLAAEDLAASTQDDDAQHDSAAEPAYFDDLDLHMQTLASGHELLCSGMALPEDLQPLVDYWLLRNHNRIEVTRRELQVSQMVFVLTNDGVRRARSQAVRQLDDCIRLLELLRGSTLDLGSTRRARLAS